MHTYDVNPLVTGIIKILTLPHLNHLMRSLKKEVQAQLSMADQFCKLIQATRSLQREKR